MLLSGYSEEERNQIIKEGLARCYNILEKVEQGERSMYRPATWFTKERAIGRVRSSNNWYGVTKDTVLLVQATPWEIFKMEVQAVVKAHGLKVKVVEAGGRSKKQYLQRSDVRPVQSCGLPRVVCETGGKRCHLESVGYQVKCEGCGDLGIRTVMHGETGQCGRVRCNQDQSALMRKKISNLWEHCVEKHNGQIVPFKYTVTSSFERDPLCRQLDEARRIWREAQKEDSTLMNDKLEWVRPAEVVVTAS